MKDITTLKYLIKEFLINSNKDCIVINETDNLTLSVGVSDYPNNNTLFILVSECESDIDYHYFEGHKLDTNGEFLNIVYDKYIEFFKKYILNDN